MPINVNLSPDRGAAAQTLMNRNDGDILRNVATQAFPGRINANTEYYGHEDKQQLRINGGQRLDIVFNYLLTNGEVKNPDAGNNKEMKIYVKLEDAAAPIILSSSSDSDSSIISNRTGEPSEEEYQEVSRTLYRRYGRKNKKSTKKRKSTKKNKRRKTNKRKTNKKKTRRNTKRSKSRRR